MKNLANCTPREFLKQTNLIRKNVAKWLSLTQIMEIRKRLPQIGDDNTADDVAKAFAAQIAANGNAILDAVMEDHADETVELLGLMCFIEPDDLDNHTMAELLDGYADVLECPEVIRFFTSLTRWASPTTLTTAAT